MNKPMAQMTSLERENVRLKDGVICEANECERGVLNLKTGYCSKHNARFKRYGRLDRVTGHPNLWIVQGGVAETKVSDKKILVDEHKLSQVSNRVWSYSPKNGAVHQVWNGKNILMHRLLTDAPDDKEVDHINGNNLDNRMENLRLVDHWENMVNTESREMRNIEKNSSGYYVRLRANGDRHYIGQFKTLKEAKAARDKAAEKYHGDLRAR